MPLDKGGFLQDGDGYKAGTCEPCSLPADDNLPLGACKFGEERHQVECKSWYKMEGPACQTIRVTVPMSATKTSTAKHTATMTAKKEATESAEATAHATADKTYDVTA